MTSMRMPARRWEHPSEHSFWKSLSGVEREAYERIADRQVFPAGTVLCQEGSSTSHVVVISSGWTAVSAYIEGKNRIVAIRGPGDLIGERVALSGRARSATVTALGEVVGFVAPAHAFLELVALHRPIMAVLERQERERLAEDDNHLRHGDTSGVEHRLAYLLSELAFRRGDMGTSLSLPMSRSEMARWIDAETQEVNRVLNGWRRLGLISTARRMLMVVDARRLNEIARRRAEPPAWSSLNCTIFVADVAGFGATCRNESDRLVVKQTLYEILPRAFAESGVSWVSCYHEDRGDGVVVVVPPQFPTRAVADPMLPVLAAELRKHNRRAADPAKIRLRTALHVGPVARDEEGLNGDAIIHAARMLDAPPLRDVFRTSDADLAFMASDYVFDNVLRHDPGIIDSRTFTQVTFRVKESNITAWLYTENRLAPAAPAEPVTTPERTMAPAHVTHFHDAVKVAGDLVIGNKITTNSLGGYPAR